MAVSDVRRARAGIHCNHRADCWRGKRAREEEGERETGAVSNNTVILTELRLLRAAVDALTAEVRAGGSKGRDAQAFRNVYSAEEFSAEVLEGKRTPIWVRRQCKKK